MDDPLFWPIIRKFACLVELASRILGRGHFYHTPFRMDFFCKDKCHCVLHPNPAAGVGVHDRVGPDEHIFYKSRDVPRIWFDLGVSRLHQRGE
jgi:hypothetical protein